MQENEYFLFSSDILEKRKWLQWDYRSEKPKTKKVENGRQNTRKVLIVEDRKDSLKSNIVVLEEE
jgi:hypothetical protein